MAGEAARLTNPDQPVYMHLDLEKAYNHVPLSPVVSPVGVWGTGPTATGYPVPVQPK